MKGKLSSVWRVAVALVLVLSFSLVATAPVSADDYESGTAPFDISVVTDPVSPEDGDVPTITATVTDADGDPVSGIGVTLVGLSDNANQPLVSPAFTEFTGIQSADISATENYPAKGDASLTQATSPVEPGGSGADMGRGIDDAADVLTLTDSDAVDWHFMILAFGDGTDSDADTEYDVLYFVNLDDGSVDGPFNIDNNNDGSVDNDTLATSAGFHIMVDTSGDISNAVNGAEEADVDYEIDDTGTDLTTATYDIDCELADAGGADNFDTDFDAPTFTTSIDSQSGTVKVSGEVTMDDGEDANDFWFLVTDTTDSGVYDQMFIVQENVPAGQFAAVLNQVDSGEVFNADDGVIGNDAGVTGGLDFKVNIAGDGTVSILDDILVDNVWVDTYAIATSQADGKFILETALPLPAGAAYDAIVDDSVTNDTFDRIYFDVDGDGEIGAAKTIGDRVADETDTLDWWVDSVSAGNPIVLQNSAADGSVVDGGVVADVVSQLPASADNTWFASDAGGDGTMDAAEDTVDLNGDAGGENLVLATIPAGSSILKVYVDTDQTSTNSWEEGPFVIGDDVNVDYKQTDTSTDDVHATLISETRAVFRVDDPDGDNGAPIVDIAKTGSSGQVQFLNTVVHGVYPVYSDDGTGTAIEALISVSEVMDLDVSTDITGLSWGESEFVTVTTKLDGNLVDGTDPDFWDAIDAAPLAGSDDAEAGTYATTMYHNINVGPTTIRLYKPLPNGSAAVDATGDVVKNVVGDPLTATYQVDTKQIASNGEQVFQIDAANADDAGTWTFVATLEYDANGNDTDDPGELHRGIAYVTVGPKEDALVEVQPSSLIQNMPTTLTVDTGVDADGDGEIDAGEEADNAIVSFDGAGFKYQTSFELVLDQTDVSDFSNLPAGVDYMWASFNEASQGLDFNHDGNKTDTWYVVAYGADDGDDNFDLIAIDEDQDFDDAANTGKAVGDTLVGFDGGGAKVFAIAPDGSSVHLGTPDGLGGLDVGQYEIDLAAGEISGTGTIDVDITTADGDHTGSTTMTVTEAGVLNAFTEPSEIPAATHGTTLDVTILDGDGNEVALKTIEVSGPGIDRTYDSNLEAANIGSVTGVDGEVRLGDGNTGDGNDGAGDVELFAYQAGNLTITVTDATADNNVKPIDVPITGYLVSVDTAEVDASADGSVETDILVTVTDTEGTPVNNAQVWIGFDSNADKIIDGNDANTWNVDGAAVNINNGEYTVTVNPTQADLMTVTVEASDNNVMASLYEVIESVGSPTLSLTSDTDVITAGMLNEFQVTVLDADDNPVTGLAHGDFDFTGDFTEGTDITASDAVTEVEDGVYKFTDIVPTATGTLTVRAKDGLDYGTVDISAEAPQVSLNLTTITAGISETDTIEVTVKDALGNDVTDARVQPAPSIVNTNPADDEVNDSSVATIQNEDATVTYIDALPIDYTDADVPTLAPAVGDFVDLIDNDAANQDSKILDLDADEAPDHAAYVNNDATAAIPVTGDDSKVVFTVTGARSGDLRFLVGNSTATFLPNDYEEDVLVDAMVTIENPGIEVTDLAGQPVTAVIVGQLQNFVIRVTDISGEPVAEQEVELHDVATVEGMGDATVEAFGNTDENGEVTLSYMPTGTGTDRIKFTTPELRNATPKVALAMVDVVTKVLESISAEPSEVSLLVDETQQLTVTATYSDDSTADVTAEASYVSDDETVATVSDAGLITAVAEGSATITVSYETKTDTVAVTVSAAVKGDFDGDGDIDLADFVEFAAAYGSSTGDPNYDAAGDFDDSGDIGLADFVEFAAVYGT